MTMGMGTWATKSAATVVVSTDGTGDTNDIQTGINLLPAAGGVVYIREGTYTITEDIVIDRDNVALIGAGASTRIETLEPNIEMISATGNRDGILIKNIYLYGNQAGANCFGIVLSHGLETITNSIISECWIERCSNINLYVRNGTDILIRDCIIFDGNNEGLYFDTGINCSFIGNAISDCLINIRIDGCENSIISNNSSYDSIFSGIWNRNSLRSRIMGNHCYENAGDGILVTGSSNCVVLGNICNDNDIGDLATYDGIQIDDDSDNCIVTSNRCEDNDRYEINIANANCNNTIILGNNCIGADHVGTINDVGTNTMIAHNKP